ncbi:hypothetical protein DUK53_11005 [Listeria sp. SHR_NRA_18]|uniref:hypothetical protein n=1 Tax=Listeria sp. SHR_NRA_18 TaxID=2269046 RepID=UPI00051DD0CB|nr:hypothetical protein [Listeria sp. SHR_NRA_18]KGL42445.1 hypothetical protein EP56_09545 [Listeriaceae bacterium FSL A5-0209]RQW66645.1 hypothetical protein DUK53_11005 [Listeria sp. SHR_NRA_18]
MSVLKYPIFVLLLVSLIFNISCSNDDSAPSKTPTVEKAVSIDDMQNKIDVNDMTLAKFTKKVTGNSGHLTVILGIKSTTYDTLGTVTEPNYYTFLLPENMAASVKPVPADRVVVLDDDAITKNGINVNSFSFAGERYTFLEIEQSVVWDANSDIPHNLDGVYHFAIQNKNYANTFYFHDVQTFVTAFEQEDSYQNNERSAKPSGVSASFSLFISLTRLLDIS